MYPLGEFSKGLLQIFSLILFVMMIIKAIQNPKEAVKVISLIIIKLVVLWITFFACIKAFGNDNGVLIGGIAVLAVWTLLHEIVEKKN